MKPYIVTCVCAARAHIPSPWAVPPPRCMIHLAAGLEREAGHVPPRRGAARRVGRLERREVGPVRLRVRVRVRVRGVGRLERREVGPVRLP